MSRENEFMDNKSKKKKTKKRLHGLSVIIFVTVLCLEKKDGCGMVGTHR